MADNRKTFRLEDSAQEILTATKDRRGGTENDAVNYIITTFPDQGKKITELNNDLIKVNNQLQDECRKVKQLEAEKSQLKAACQLIRTLFDSSPAADLAGASPGPANS